MFSSTTDGARGRRRTRATIATAAALVATAALAGPASANLTAASPTLNAFGFPSFYQDSAGTQLELCVEDPKCPASPKVADLTSPDGEAFYQLASGNVTDADGHDVAVDMNVEAAYLPDGTDPAHPEITFGRVQVTMKGMEADSDYTITYPYGTFTVHTDAHGEIIGNNRTRQRIETGCADTPCDFSAALGTPIGPFLRWAADPANPADVPPAGYIGDGVTPHTVVGSPFDTNFIRVEGPGLPDPVTDPLTGALITPGGISTDEFIVEGKLAGAPAARFFAASNAGAFGVHTLGTTATKDVAIRNVGSGDMTLGAVSISGSDFAIVDASDCDGATIPAGGTCTVAVRFTPSASGNRSGTLSVDQDGVMQTVALTGSGINPKPTPASEPTQPQQPPQPQPQGGNTTIIQIVRAPAPAQGVQGVTASAPLAVDRLSLARRISVARLRVRGLRASMSVAEGTSVVRIAVYKARHGVRTGRALFITTRTPRSAGLFRVTLRSSALARLKPGSYVMEVRAGRSAATLGAIRRIAFRVTR